MGHCGCGGFHDDCDNESSGALRRARARDRTRASFVKAVELIPSLSIEQLDVLRFAIDAEKERRR